MTSAIPTEDINDIVIDIIAQSVGSVSESQLALTGDKRFLFSESKRSFIMYGVKGRNWIALGAPIGQKSESEELIAQFLSLARASKYSPAFYAVRERHLERFSQTKLKSQKIGEMALVALDNFSLEGKDNAKHRHARNKAVREGVSFKIIRTEVDSPEMDKLESISKDWLAHQSGREKGFSLGRFDRKVLSNQAIAIAMKADEIIAFSNLWSSADGSELSLDLMRYLENSMAGVIDFLLVETMLWGRENGYKTFSLGMAPLAGLDKEDHRSVMSSLCRFAFKHGDKLYSFQGIRRFKKKYNPDWEAVYLMAPSQLHMPRALKNLALLSAGSLKGIFRRP